MRAFALLAAIVAADASDFPQDDKQHADCHLAASFEEITCESLFKVIATLIEK